MQDKSPACKSYRIDQSVCSDGFIQKPYCGGNFGCPMCGAGKPKHLPQCLLDDGLDAPHFTEGRPRYYREMPHAG